MWMETVTNEVDSQIMRILGNIEGKIDTMTNVHEDFKAELNGLRGELTQHKADTAKDKNLILGGVAVVGVFLTGGLELIKKVLN